MAQMIDSCNDILSFGNHNEDCAQSRIRPTNQSFAPCIHTEDTDSGKSLTGHRGQRFDVVVTEILGYLFVSNMALVNIEAIA